MLWMQFVICHLLAICFLVNLVRGNHNGHSSSHMTGLFHGKRFFPRKGHGIRPQKNCTSLDCINRKGIDNKILKLIHIKSLKDRILGRLNMQTNESGSIQTPFEQPKDFRESIRQEEKDRKKKPTTASYIREFSEIISFSEKASNVSEKNVLSFTIDVSNNPGPLEALSAHLWILMRKRKRKNNRGKKIYLEVLSLNETNHEVLTSLITRVKKTRWQKVSLPVTFIQSVLDSNKRRLKLRITCRKCGKVVRLVLFRKSKNHKKDRQMKKETKNRSKTHQKRRARKFRSKKVKSQKNERVPPFLVISTRYKHTISTS